MWTQAPYVKKKIADHQAMRRPGNLSARTPSLPPSAASSARKISARSDAPPEERPTTVLQPEVPIRNTNYQN